MNPVFNKRYLIVPFCITILLLAGSCGSGIAYENSHDVENPAGTEIGSLLWVNEFHTDSAVKEAVRHTLDNSSIIISQISWSPHDSSFFNNASWYYNLARDHDKKFMLSIDWQNFQRTGTLGDWSFKHDSVRDKYREDILNLIEVYSPDYIQLGVEINYYGLIDTEGYKGFIKTYNELKEEINSDYESLEVGLSFQLELLFGVHHDWENNRTLETLDAVSKNLDFIGVSTYPDEYYGNEKDALGSLKYLDSLKSYYQNIIIISETAISSLNFESEIRNRYQDALFNKARELELKVLIWGSMIDHEISKGWQHRIGLLNSDGTPKEDFENWKIRSSEIKIKS